MSFFCAVSKKACDLVNTLNKSITVKTGRIIRKLFPEINLVISVMQIIARETGIIKSGNDIIASLG